MPDAPTPIHSRREPIETTVGEQKFLASPVGWRERNKLGQAMVENYAKAINGGVSVIEDEQGVKQLQYTFAESLIDYDAIIALAYPDESSEHFNGLTFEELIEVLTAALTVNGLERQVYMLDLGKDRPGSPLAIAGVTLPEESADGAKIESPPAS